MFKLFAVASMATVALAAPQPEADPQLYIGGAVGAVAPIAPALAPNCRIEHEDIETAVCTPRLEDVCVTTDVMHDDVEVEVVCKDVVSKHCAGAGHVVLKREADAEADPEADPLFYHHAGAIAPHAAIVAAPAAAAVTTVKHPCQEVTTKHCVNNPKKVTKSAPLKRCHVEQKVDCTPTVQKVAKTICDEVETTHLTHAPFYAAHHLGAYLH